MAPKKISSFTPSSIVSEIDEQLKKTYTANEENKLVMRVLQDMKRHDLYRLRLTISHRQFIKVILKRTGLPDPLLEKTTIEDIITEMGDSALREVESQSMDIVLKREYVGFSHLVVRKKQFEKEKTTPSEDDLIALTLGRIYRTLHEVCTSIRESEFTKKTGSKLYQAAEYYSGILIKSIKIEEDLLVAYKHRKLSQRHQQLVTLVKTIGLERATILMAKIAPDMKQDFFSHPECTRMLENMLMDIQKKERDSYSRNWTTDRDENFETNSHSESSEGSMSDEEMYAVVGAGIMEKYDSQNESINPQTIEQKTTLPSLSHLINNSDEFIIDDDPELILSDDSLTLNFMDDEILMDTTDPHDLENDKIEIEYVDPDNDFELPDWLTE